MKINKLARRGAKALFHSCQVNGLLDEARVRQAVQRVTQSKPRGYVAVLSHFLRLVTLEVARRSARVETVVPLAEAAQAAVQANLGRLYGPGLSFRFEQNPALIGGMRVQVGSDVYDGSIEGRLARLEDSF